ncbi:MAG: circadian clock protein KaiB [Bradymonadales bacterium]|nr:MAG: circadian clock protein KaiB [Bradymonadales bacterium]
MQSSIEALSYLKKLRQTYFQIEELEVVDILENWEEAERVGIVATPTLMILDPPPARRIIGCVEGLEDLLGLDRAVDLRPGL